MRRDYFTLLELLVAIAVIAVLAGLTVGGARFAFQRSEEATIRSRMQKLEMALESYRRDWGYYPIKPYPQVTKAAIDNTGPSGVPDNKIDLQAPTELKFFQVDFPLISPQGTPYLDEEIGTTKPYRQTRSGMPFFYQYPSNAVRSLKNTGRYDLWAAGVDEVFHTNDLPADDYIRRSSKDDITNWTKP